MRQTPNTVKTSLSKLIDHVASENTIMFVADTHTDKETQLTFTGAEMVRTLAARGYKHIIREQGEELQPYIDSYMADKSPQAFEKFYSDIYKGQPPDIKTLDPEGKSFLEGLQEAKKLGVSIHCVEKYTGLIDLRKEFEDILPVHEMLDEYRNKGDVAGLRAYANQLPPETLDRTILYEKKWLEARWLSDQVAADKAVELSEGGKVKVAGMYGTNHLSKANDIDEMIKAKLPGTKVATIRPYSDESILDGTYQTGHDYAYDLNQGVAAKLGGHEVTKAGKVNLTDTFSNAANGMPIESNNLMAFAVPDQKLQSIAAPGM